MDSYDRMDELADAVAERDRATDRVREMAVEAADCGIDKQVIAYVCGITRQTLNNWRNAPCRSRAPRTNKSDRWRLYGIERGNQNGWRCEYCGDSIDLRDYHVDHAHPVSRADEYDGDIDGRENARLACARCNMSKNYRTEEEYLTLLRSQPATLPLW